MSDPNRGPVDLRPVLIRGLPLPLREEFGDAFDGKHFVRFPHRERPPVNGRPSRLPVQPPLVPGNSVWLPDYCIITSNILELEKQKRARSRPRMVPHLRGLAARV